MFFRKRGTIPVTRIRAIMAKMLKTNTTAPHNSEYDRGNADGFEQALSELWDTLELGKV